MSASPSTNAADHFSGSLGMLAQVTSLLHQLQKEQGRLQEVSHHDKQTVAKLQVSKLRYEQEADARDKQWDQELHKLTELHALRLSALEKKQAALAAQNEQLCARCQELEQQAPSKQAELQGCQQQQQRPPQVVDEPKLLLHHHSTAATLAGTAAAKQQALTQQLAGQQQGQALRGQVSPKGTGMASGLRKLPLQTTAKAADDDKDVHIVQLEATVAHLNSSLEAAKGWYHELRIKADKYKRAYWEAVRPTQGLAGHKRKSPFAEERSGPQSGLRTLHTASGSGGKSVCSEEGGSAHERLRSIGKAAKGNVVLAHAADSMQRAQQHRQLAPQCAASAGSAMAPTAAELPPCCIAKHSSGIRGPSQDACGEQSGSVSLLSQAADLPLSLPSGHSREGAAGPGDHCQSQGQRDLPEAANRSHGVEQLLSAAPCAGCAMENCPAQLAADRSGWVQVKEEPLDSPGDVQQFSSIAERPSRPELNNLAATPSSTEPEATPARPRQAHSSPPQRTPGTGGFTLPWPASDAQALVLASAARMDRLREGRTFVLPAQPGRTEQHAFQHRLDSELCEAPGDNPDHFMREMQISTEQSTTGVLLAPEPVAANHVEHPPAQQQPQSQSWAPGCSRQKPHGHTTEAAQQRQGGVAEQADTGLLAPAAAAEVKQAPMAEWTGPLQQQSRGWQPSTMVPRGGQCLPGAAAAAPDEAPVAEEDPDLTQAHPSPPQISVAQQRHRPVKQAAGITGAEDIGCPRSAASQGVKRAAQEVSREAGAGAAIRHRLPRGWTPRPGYAAEAAPEAAHQGAGQRRKQQDRGSLPGPAAALRTSEPPAKRPVLRMELVTASGKRVQKNRSKRRDARAPAAAAPLRSAPQPGPRPFAAAQASGACADPRAQQQDLPWPHRYPPPAARQPIGPKWHKKVYSRDFDVEDSGVDLEAVAPGSGGQGRLQAAGLEQEEQRTTPRTALGPGEYKYQDVVRKKAEREALQGFDCPDCRRFFEAMKSWGDGQPLPACGHVESKAGAQPGQLTKAAQEEASRHRNRYRPPSTPPGFWDMGFMDSLDSRVNPHWAMEDSTQDTNSAQQQAGC